MIIEDFEKSVDGTRKWKTLNGVIGYEDLKDGSLQYLWLEFCINPCSSHFPWKNYRRHLALGAVPMNIFTSTYNSMGVYPALKYKHLDN